MDRAPLLAYRLAMRWLLALALLLLPFPVAAQQSTLAPDSEARWVPFEITSTNHIRFALTLGGKPATAILDTGVSVSVVTPRFAAAAGMRPAANSSIEAVGGAVRVGWTALDTLTIGGLTRHGGRLAITDIPAGVTGEGAAPELLIGSDILSCCALELDFDARRFRILASGRLPFTGAVAPLARDPTLGVFVTTISIAGKKLRPVMIDTGDGGELTLDHVAWAHTGIKPVATTTMVARGMGGRIQAEVTTLPHIEIGPLQTGEVEVWIEGERGLSGKQGFAGRIGSLLLQRYHVLLDAGAGRMMFSPGVKSVLPPTRWTSGLVLALQGQAAEVAFVMRGSPAAAAAWKVGDRICGIEGAPVTIASAKDAVAGAAGRTLQFEMCDGSARSLVLRRFY